MDLNKHIWEGWTVQDFIDDLSMEVGMIMRGESWKKPFTSRAELKKYCMENQSYYKKYIKGVVDYFANKYQIN
jgi:hypothetical protein